MSTKLIAIIVAVVLAGGGAWWFTQDSSDTPSSSQQNTSQLSEAASINELLGRGQDLVCTFSHTDEFSNVSSGTVYFSDGKMSGDFTLVSPDEDPMESHVINDGTTQYMWEHGQSEGYKFNVADIDAQDDTDSSDTPVSSVEQDEDYDFDCQSWQPDESRFMPPADVSFTDFSAQIEQVQQQSSESLREACATIDNAEARAACEANL